MTNEPGERPAATRPVRRVWVDAQLPPSMAEWLRTAHGMEAVHLQELGLHQALDSVIFSSAREADAAVILVTKDDDFVKLLGQHGPPPQVVWVRCGNVTNPELRRIVLEAWPRAATLLDADEPLVEIRRRKNRDDG